MPTINEISISYATLLGFNGLAALALWAEYSTSRQTFIRYALIGQMSSLLWQCVNLILILNSGVILVYYISSFFLGLSGFCFLAASANNPRFNSKSLFVIATVYAVLLTVDYIWQLGFIFLLRSASAFAFFATPLVSVVFIKGGFKFLMATMQLFAAVTTFTSLALIDGENAEVGALLYLLAGLLIPINSICFVILSTNMSRQRVLESERKYRVFFESVNDAFFETDANFRVTNISPSINQFGIDRAQVMGESLLGYLDERDNFKSLAKASLSSREAFQLTSYFMTGEGPIDCEITCTPVQDGSSGPIQYAGTIRNTHERNLLERQFINAQRHESLGKLAGGIAHDFNNLLQGILGHAELLKNYPMSPEQRDTSLEAIAKGAASAGGLCRQLLLYTGTGTNLKEDFELSEQVGEIAEIIRPSLPKQSELHIGHLDSPTFIRGDKAQVGQIVMNLVKNAIESGDSNVRVELTLTQEQITDPLSIESQMGNNLSVGSYAKLVVQDNGCGIEPVILSKIFDPFFTTKPKGHGLGLAAIVGILVAHGGTITVESDIGHGTRFTVWIPVVANPNIHEPVKPSMPGDPLSILHVDDEEELLVVGKTMLEQMGHRVRSANSGERALEVLAEEAEDIDLVISDIKMPGMDGISLMRTVFDDYPAIPVILASGYAEITNALTDEESLKIRFLGKPYNYEELLLAIESSRRKLDQNSNKYAETA